jgi:hypothetical protein
MKKDRFFKKFAGTIGHSYAKNKNNTSIMPYTI